MKEEIIDFVYLILVNTQCLILISPLKPGIMIDTCTMNTSPHEASALLKKGITESGKYEIMISEGMRWSFSAKQ